MLETFRLTITQLMNMFFFMVTGYVMRKKKIGGEEVGKVLSSLLVNLFCPAITFSSLSEWFHISELAENIAFVWAAVVTFLISFPVAFALGRWFGKTGMEKDIYTYGLYILNPKRELSWKKIYDKPLVFNHNTDCFCVVRIFNIIGEEEIIYDYTIIGGEAYEPVICRIWTCECNTYDGDCCSWVF